MAFPCRVLTCDNLVATKGGACQDHQDAPGSAAASFYDRHLRNRKSKAFYNSAAWKRARATKLANNPVCEWPGCGKFAQHVHHKKPLDRCTREEKLAQSNLKSLCAPHHNAEEAEARRINNDYV